MRVRVFVLASLVCGSSVGLACIPDPAGDFEKYQEDIAPYASQGGGTFDGSAATEAVAGTYYGACLSELGQSNPDKVFNFLVDTKFNPNPGGAGGQLSLKLTVLKTQQTGEPSNIGRVPPEFVSRANATGTPLGDDTKFVPTDAQGKFAIVFGDVNVPGDANPISQRPVVILNGAMNGRFSQNSFCTRLSGDVTVPLSVTLTPALNICQFRPIKEGDPTPKLTKDDFLPGTCPE
jgi:hypothetical protein